MRFCGDIAAWFLGAHARALFGAGAVERARDVSAQAIAVAKRQDEPVHQCEATIADVRSLRELEGVSARRTIEGLFQEALQLIEQTGAERWRPHVHVERAELYRLAGNSDAARREFTKAHRLFAETGATGHAERIAALLAAQ
jgi:hypothetical protein